jgi:RimJ/RimL family protein N-acetyltransferase
VFRHVPIGGWKSIDEAHQLIARAITMVASGDGVRLAMERREDKRVIGEALLFNFENERTRAEIGYGLGRPAWGHGYATEAVRPLVDFGFRELGLRRIGAIIDPRNGPSARVLQRLGFSHEGTLRQHTLMRGEVSDTGVYSLLRTEWEGAR